MLQASKPIRHDPEKHALGLDPWVETGFRKKFMPSKKAKRQSDSAKLDQT